MEKQSQNPMAVEPIPRLMARIGTPIVLSMILQAAYNVVDSAYLARMADGGEAALTALSLAFPVQLFMVAVSIGTGVGTNALLARLLGQGDREQANRTVGNAQFIALCITVVFMLFAAVGVRPYVYSQSAGGSIGRDILESAIAYLHICCGVPVGIVLGVRKSLAGHWAIAVLHHRPNHRRSRQYRGRSRFDLRHIRPASHGGARCRVGHSAGPARLHGTGASLPPAF